VNIFALETFNDEGNCCSFYTVRVMEPESELSETDKFFNKFRASHTEALQMLAEFIDTTIGNEMGALDEFFRFENSAMAMPPSSVSNIRFDFKGFPLRLYCLKISESLVILFNGGEKTTRNAQGGDTSMAFIEANQYANRIQEAIINKEIIINGRLILSIDLRKPIIL
jgi:hypothetical protein